MASTGVNGEDTLGEGVNLSDAERELIRDELKKTEEEINTLRAVLASRQKHAISLKHKLGITPFSELQTEVAQGLRTAKETPLYQKTSGVVAGAADVANTQWQGVRNSTLFKSFESKLGSALTNAKMAASTSIDQLSQRAQPNAPASQAQTPNGDKPSPAPLS